MVLYKTGDLLQDIFYNEWKSYSLEKESVALSKIDMAIREAVNEAITILNNFLEKLAIGVLILSLYVRLLKQVTY